MNPHLQRGLLLFQQSRHELAETELRQALTFDPDDAYAHALLALCLAHREQFKEATEEAQQAIHLAPDFSFAHYALAHIWHERHHYDQALAAVNEALRIDPEDADYCALLSQIHLDLKQWAPALAAAERGLQFNPEHVACTNLRAIALVKLGRKAEAGATIDAALAKNPDNAVTHANQGWTLLEQNQPERALHHFREALRLEPDNEWARAGIIEALKARYFIYSIFLRYFLWMAKLSPNVQWGIIIAGWFGNRMLGSAAKANPDLAPFIWPVRILYLAFVFLTWTADPLFNLLLRLNRFGRLALTEEKTRASNWVGSCLLLAVLALIACALNGFAGPWVLAALVFGFLVIPMSGTFNCREGWPRKMMAGYTALMAAAGLAGFGLALVIEGRPKSEVEPLVGLMTGCFSAFFIGAIGSSWVANFLMTRQPRR